MIIIIIRTVIVYLLIVFALRLMGKKQLGELQPSELVTTIMVSNIATLSLEDSSAPMIMGIIPILMIVCLDVLMSGISLKSNSIRKLISGSPKIVVSNGIVDQAQLKALRFTVDDLVESMRTQGIFDLSQVQYAIVETTGKINFLEKPEPPQNPPELIIKDGEINPDGLTSSGLGEGWVKKILAQNKAQEKDVFMLFADSNGNYNLILKNKEEIK